MEKSVSITSLVRRVGVIAVAGAATAALAGGGAGSAQAAPKDNLPDSCWEISENGGSAWGGLDTIKWNAKKPSPGSQITHADFQARNTCDKPAKMQIWVGEWSISGGGSGNVRANLGTHKSDTKDLVGTDPILVVETGRVAKNEVVPVELFVGIPKGETVQGFTIQPGWRMFLEEVEPDAPVDPGPGGGDGGSGSSTGSLGDLFGSLSTADAKVVGKSLNAPKVTAGR